MVCLYLWYARVYIYYALIGYWFTFDFLDRNKVNMKKYLLGFFAITIQSVREIERWASARRSGDRRK